LRDHLQKAAARGVIFGVALQVFRELRDPAGEEGDLYIGAPRVLLVQSEFLDIQRFSALCHKRRAYFRRRNANRKGRYEDLPLWTHFFFRNHYASRTRFVLIMKSSTKNRVKGRVRETEGKVKLKAGRTTGSRKLQDRGAIETLAGTLQRKLGELKKTLGR
jgi:uncharacterized protein YjbJ (UPF0337 family)